MSSTAAAGTALEADGSGYTIDPTQHTALVMGRVDNPDNRLRAGQFVTATVELPPSVYEVEVPTTSLVEDGQESILFIQHPGAPLGRAIAHATETEPRNLEAGIAEADVIHDGFPRGRASIGEEDHSLFAAGVGVARS